MKNPKYLSRAAWVFVTAACLSLSAGSSIGAALTGDYLGKTEAEIAQNLAEKGYEVDDLQGVEEDPFSDINEIRPRKVQYSREVLRF